MGLVEFRQDAIKCQLSDRQGAEQLLGEGRPESCLEAFVGSAEEKVGWEETGAASLRLASARCVVAALGPGMCLLAAVLHQAQVLLPAQLLHQPQVLPTRLGCYSLLRYSTRLRYSFKLKCSSELWCSFLLSCSSKFRLQEQGNHAAC